MLVTIDLYVKKTKRQRERMMEKSIYKMKEQAVGEEESIGIRLKKPNEKAL